MLVKYAWRSILVLSPHFCEWLIIVLLTNAANLSRALAFLFPCVSHQHLAACLSPALSTPLPFSPPLSPLLVPLLQEQAPSGIHLPPSSQPQSSLPSRPAPYLPLPRSLGCTSSEHLPQ